MSDRTATLTAILKDGVSGPAKTIRAELTGIATDTSKAGEVLVGSLRKVGEMITNVLAEGIGRVATAIPALLEQGNSYLEKLHQIQLETGMTAEQTSTLVGVFRDMGVPTDQLDTLFARLGVNIAGNEDKFRALGVATRDSNGGMLGTYQIIQNLRQAVQEHGESLLTTAAAQSLFGRSGFKIMEALQATDAQWAESTERVRRWGGVVSQAAIAGADRFGDTLASLAQGITDIGVNIASAVDPYLRAFVESFSKFVQSHLNEIVTFAVNVVNVVTGFISGLFGITSAVEATAGTVTESANNASAATDTFGSSLKTAAGGADVFTTSVNGQIKAIDAHIKALEAAAARRQAIQQREKLEETLTQARGQLADLQGNAPFVSGLSNAEQQLALEKHSQDIIDARKNVRDAVTAIGNFEADQKDRAERELLNREKQRLQDSLASHKAANAGILESGLRMGAGLDKNMSTVLGNLGVKTAEFGRSAASSFQSGIDAAKGFLDILLGASQLSPLTGQVTRTGGVIGALAGLGLSIDGVGRVAGSAAGTLGPIARFLGDVARAFSDMGDQLTYIAGALQDFGLAIHAFLVNAINMIPGFKFPDIPNPFKFATGGMVPATAGGQSVTVGDGGEDEFIIPRSKMGGGGTTIINYNSIWPPTAQQAREIADVIDRQFGIRTANTAVGR